MIYLDSAALVKLARAEPHSAELRDWLTRHGRLRLVASSLVEVELPRALRRHAPADLPHAADVLDRLYRIEIDREVRTIAASFTEAGLRSLDAIHLATAQLLNRESNGELRSFVTYDRRLLAAATEAGLRVDSPGQLIEGAQAQKVRA